jgi:DUF1680 family protein
VTRSDGGPWTIGLRVPDWATGATLTDPSGTRPVSPGVVTVRREFAVDDEVRLHLPMRPRWTFPDSRIDAVRGCVAVERGPVVLCAESTDQVTPDLDLLRVDPTAPLGTVDSDVADVDTVDTVVARGHVARPPELEWPYEPGVESAVPTDVVPVRLIPYHRWARRGSSTMRIWLPRA